MRTRNAMQLKAQIRNKAKDVGTTPQLMMQNYLLERIIERISLSHLRDNVVIKGGVLKRNSVRFRRWHRQPPIRFRSGMGCGSGGVWALKLPLIWRRHWRRLCRAVK